VSAQFNLGVMYDNGQGVPRDVVLAYALYNLAAAENEKAANNRNIIAKEMTGAQIEEGQAITSKWRVGQPCRPRAKQAASSRRQPQKLQKPQPPKNLKNPKQFPAMVHAVPAPK